jgi:4-amino-4-deoxy-L-arabinose transferase-like glycosyltransferase
MTTVEHPPAQQQERTIVALLLIGFGILWFLFTDLSLASVDVHLDLSEMSVWAEHFAFGYKHPPLSGWIFAAWFAIFPRENWAAHLLAVSTVTTTLAITWCLLRDQLSFERALVGLAALALVPLYTFQAIKFNANLVQMPFWAGALLYYLRARRDLGVKDAALAGVFAALTFLGKYWGVYLLAGMAVAAISGSGTRRFWTSEAPYVMAVAALIVVAPHLHWLLTERGKDTDSFLAQSVFSERAPLTDIAHSILNLVATIAYVVMPLVFFAALRPSRAAIADTVWPKDAQRQQSLILLIVPLIVPALVNVAFPHRLTAVWTFPNWAILPVVLYGSPLLVVPRAAATRAVTVAAIVSLCAVLAAPWIAYRHLSDASYFHRQHWQQLANAVAGLSQTPVRVFHASNNIVDGLAFYMPLARPLSGILSRQERAERERQGLAVICTADDKPCQVFGDGRGRGQPWSDVSLTRTFLGFAGPAMAYRIKIISTP